MEEIIAPAEWHEVVSLIQRGTVLIFGAPDRGKTTLARFLIEKWCGQGRRVALIDGDIGQSTLGPPATVGLALFDSPPSDWERIHPLSLRFIGSVTPVGYMLPFLVGLKKLVEEATRYEAQIILVDTTGLIRGEGGRELKFNKVELLRPSHLLALERSGELEHILRPLEKIGEVEIHRLPVSEKAKARSREQRKAYRRRKFQEYFQNARVKEIPLRAIAFQGSWLGSGEEISSDDLDFLANALKTRVLHAERGAEGIFVLVKGGYSALNILSLMDHFGTKNISVNSVEDLQDSIVGLNNAANQTLALGILMDLNFPEGKLLIKTPLGDLSKVKVIQFGSVKYE